MRLLEAERRARVLVAQMAPYCERVVIAGSIRRRAREVKDIEIVCIPRWENRPDNGLFGEEVPVNVLHADWACWPGRTGLDWIKPGTSEILNWPVKADGKYWRAVLREAPVVKVDIFLATPDNWGLILAIRTGSAEFSQALVTHANRLGMPSRDGSLRRPDGSPVPTRTEEEVFRVLGLQWVEPHLRTGAEAVRRARP